MKDCSRRQRYLVPTASTLPASQPGQFVSTPVPALRTHKIVRPTAGSQIRSTRLFGGELGLEFAQVLRKCWARHAPYATSCGLLKQPDKQNITSLKPDAARLNRAIRKHWGIENKLHWVLDVGFGEDLSRKRAGHSAQNFSLLNRIALNILKQDKSSKRGIKGKRLNAAWDHPYLLKLLGI